MSYIQNLNDGTRQSQFWSEEIGQSYTEVFHTYSGSTVNQLVSDTSALTETQPVLDPKNYPNFEKLQWVSQLTPDCEVTNIQMNITYHYCFTLTFLNEEFLWEDDLQDIVGELEDDFLD